MVDAWVIVWGTRYSRSSLGYVADFCPLCRQVSAFELFNIQEVHHFYFVFTLPGEAEAYEIQCLSCATIFPTDPSEYRHYAQCRQQDPDALAQETNPCVLDKFADRLDTEKRIREHKEVGARQRLNLLLEPFIALRPEVEIRPSTARGRRNVGVFFGSLLLACVILGTLSDLVVALAPLLKWLGAAGVAFLLGIWVILCLTEKRRVVRKRLVPKIAKALRPLGPSREELTKVLSRLAARGDPIATHVDAGELQRRIEASSSGIPKAAHALRPDWNELTLAAEALRLGEIQIQP